MKNFFKHMREEIESKKTKGIKENCIDLAINIIVLVVIAGAIVAHALYKHREELILSTLSSAMGGIIASLILPFLLAG